MRKLKTVMAKELLLLWRDRASLAVLFLMPVILVVVVSLVQHNVLKTLDQPKIRVLLVNHDKGELADQLIRELDGSPMILLTKQIGYPISDMGSALKKVADGTYQFCLYIPAGVSAQVEILSRQAGAALISDQPAGRQHNAEKPGPPTLFLYYDPIVQGAWRSAMKQMILGTAFATETKEKIEVYFKTIPEMIKAKLTAMDPEMVDVFEDLGVKLPDEYAHENILNLDVKAAVKSGTIMPNAVQQNIPAWTLFGMFFIVVPLAGSIIRERQEGTLIRLFTLPVSFSTILLGKVLAYMLICLVQFVLMLMVGLFILPLQGLPGLDLGGSPFGLLLVVFCAAFAATGFGLMVGAMAGSYEQGSMFGAVSVVIAAALGGIMLPVYVMPEMMQKISAFSPFSWGMSAFLELFVKGGGLWAVLPDAAYLFLFGCGTMGIALWTMLHHKLR